MPAPCPSATQNLALTSSLLADRRIPSGLFHTVSACLRMGAEVRLGVRGVWGHRRGTWWVGTHSHHWQLPPGAEGPALGQRLRAHEGGEGAEIQSQRLALILLSLSPPPHFPCPLSSALLSCPWPHHILLYCHLLLPWRLLLLLLDFSQSPSLWQKDAGDSSQRMNQAPREHCSPKGPIS